MSETVMSSYKGYEFGSSRPLGAEEADRLCAFFQKDIGENSLRLGGRAPVHREELDGPVIIKHYRRGGWAAFLFSQWYLRSGKTRSHKEFELLLAAKKMGVTVPEPLVFASHGKVIYRAWLVTKEVSDAVSLAALAATDEDRCRALMAEVSAQIRLLIVNDLCHTDLHPGNVIVDGNNRVYLIDFDKAYYTKIDRKKLRDSYFCRWRRAVIKHGLPDYLSECLSHGLRQNLPERDPNAAKQVSQVR